MQSKHRDPHLKGLHRETNDYTSPREKSKPTSNTDKRLQNPLLVPFHPRLPDEVITPSSHLATLRPTAQYV